MVGPSKFVGYKGMTVSEYMESYEELDGRDTEPVLWKLFDEVDPHHGDWKRGRETRSQGSGKAIRSVRKGA